jgi:hypothetical protein
VVAGIGPGAPGYASVRVAPHLGTLTLLDARAATPRGAVTVSYRLAAGKLTAVVERPPGLPGVFVWRGKTHPLERARTTRVLAD